MMKCPQCGTQYSDDTLRFCLQDGTPLAGAAADTPTAVLGETETAAARRAAERLRVPVGGSDPAAWPPSQVTQVAAPASHQKNANTLMVVVLTAVGMLVLFAVIGVGAWIYFRGGPQMPAGNTATNVNLPGDRGLVENGELKTQQFSPGPTSSTPASTPLPTITGNAPSVDGAQIRSEVSQRVDNWVSLTESMDLGGLRGTYAGTLDYYYTKRNVSASSVISDKQRAFRNYSSMQITVSSINVSPDVSGESATVTFSKEWTFEGAKPFCGVIRSQMKMRKVNGVWLIVGEKDVTGTFRRTC